MKITTLCYPERDGKYLMLYRNRKKNDPNGGKWIGIGGHLEKGELPAECAVRELFEETGLHADRMVLAGQIFFYSDEYEDECMYLYRAEGLSGEVTDCDEGTLEWIEKERIPTRPMWEGDRLFLDLFFEGSKFFTMSLNYQGDKLIDHKTVFESVI